MDHQANLFRSQKEPRASTTSFPISNDQDRHFAQCVTRFSGPEAARNANLVQLVSVIFNDSFGYRPDGRAYRLGPKSTQERLESTDFLFIAGEERSGIGYLFGKEIPCTGGRIAWIESMAVMPIYRKQGVATALIDKFVHATKGSSKIGCATPNPVAALVVTRSLPGKLYIGSCNPPYTLIQMLHEIRKHCFDLRGCAIQRKFFRIKTGFSPLSCHDQREWSPQVPSPSPAWWSELEHLPNEYEALLVIEKKDQSAPFHSVERTHGVSATTP